MSSRRVLVIDDDALLADQICSSLKERGYQPTAAGAKNAATVLEEAAPHLLVIDSWLPEMRSGSLVPKIRERSAVPIIVIGTENVDERVGHLEAGADDCLPKPFEVRELLARMSCILRRLEPRSHHGPESEWSCGPMTINSARRRVTVDSREIGLTATEFDLLCLFASSPNKPLSREIILEHLRGVEWEAIDRSVDILVSRLREKLGDTPRKPRFIQTVRGVGYLFLSR